MGGFLPIGKDEGEVNPLQKYADAWDNPVPIIPPVITREMAQYIITSLDILEISEETHPGNIEIVMHRDIASKMVDIMMYSKEEE